MKTPELSSWEKEMVMMAAVSHPNTEPGKRNTMLFGRSSWSDQQSHPFVCKVWSTFLQIHLLTERCALLLSTELSWETQSKELSLVPDPTVKRRSRNSSIVDLIQESKKKNRPRKIFLSFNKQFSLSLTNAYTYTNLCSSAQHLWKIIKYHV